MRFDVAFQVGEPKPGKLHKLSRIHMDIGFSDILDGKAQIVKLPQLVHTHDHASWKIYPIEQIVAEKLETLLQRNIENSRAKDVYDLTYLLPQCADKKRLRSAIQKTFESRGTPSPGTFLKAVKAFEDTSILEKSWPGVKVLEHKPPFTEMWTLLLRCLGELDKNWE